MGELSGKTPQRLHDIAMGWCDVAEAFARNGSPATAGEAFGVAAKYERKAVKLLSLARGRTMQPTLGILTHSLAFLLVKAGRHREARRVARRGLRQKGIDSFVRQRLNEALEQAKSCIKWESRVDRYYEEVEFGRLPPECRIKR